MATTTQTVKTIENSAGIPSIAEFYAGRSIFITGATGFMGKVLMEKLLRSCPDVVCIYILIRPKKGLDPRQRLENLLSSRLFDQLRQEQPLFAEKIQPVPGDILQPNMGLSEADEELLISEVSIVFHSAATVRFDEPMKISIDMNVTATQRVIDLTKKFTKLASFLHTSTAYANCDQTEISESVYTPPIHPQKLIDAVEWMDEDVLNALTPKMLINRPNTYTYTKSLAEFLIAEQCKQIPTAIFRPSIVGASWKDPIPGWVDNYNGPTGIIAAMGKGILRTMVGCRDETADLIPVDTAVNMMIAIGWHTGVYRPEVMKVYHGTTGQINRLKWGQIEKQILRVFEHHPVDGMIRVPNASFTCSRLWHEIRVRFDHMVPAYMMDLFLWITGRKPIFVKVQDKLCKSMNSLAYFTSHGWTFSNDNMFMLLDVMTDTDKQVFDFDVSKIDWMKYIETYCLGTKEFVLKEDPNKTNLARMALKRMQRINTFLNCVTVFVVWRLLMTRVKIASTVWYRLVNIIMKLYNQIPKIFLS